MHGTSVVCTLRTVSIDLYCISAWEVGNVSFNSIIVFFNICGFKEGLILLQPSNPQHTHHYVYQNALRNFIISFVAILLSAILSFWIKLCNVFNRWTLTPPDTLSRPFGTCICSTCWDQSFSELVVILPDYAPRISLGTFSIFLGHKRMWYTLSKLLKSAYAELS